NYLAIRAPADRLISLKWLERCLHVIAGAPEFDSASELRRHADHRAAVAALDASWTGRFADPGDILQVYRRGAAVSDNQAVEGVDPRHVRIQKHPHRVDVIRIPGIAIVYIGVALQAGADCLTDLDGGYAHLRGPLPVHL